MDNELMLDVGQANELKLAFRRNNWTPADVKCLCEGDILTRIQPIVQGTHEAVLIRPVFDLDAQPSVYPGWKIKEHKKCGQFKWQPEKTKLFQSARQQIVTGAIGSKLLKEMLRKNVFNANLLDGLLAYPHLIPNEWKGKRVFFWGTILSNPHDLLFVSCMSWDGKWWQKFTMLLDGVFGLTDPALIAA